LIPPDGTSIYLTRDIGSAIERYEKYKFDKLIYVIATQQDLHVAQFFKIVSLMGFEWADRLEHVNYGLVQGMSTRKGTAVFLDQIIKEAASVMHEQMRKNEDKYKQVENPEYVSQEVGITGIKVQDMAAKRYVAHIVSRRQHKAHISQDQQLYLQLGPHALLRG
jgi:arginyl-tRNA synthetase